MARYIDADKIVNGLREAVERMRPNDNTKEVIDVFCEGLQNEPTADVEEVKHGYLKRNERNIPKMREFHKKCIALTMNEKSIFYTCSCYGSFGSLYQNYCFECGAKMYGGKTE